MQFGLNKIGPDRRDFSYLHSFGATTFDTQGLPETFSIYDGREIPNQDEADTRFTPALPPLPNGCTGEAVSFASGIEDGALYNPLYTYYHTPPFTDAGRDIRAALQSAIDKGLLDSMGTIGNNRTAYFNVYGSGAISDFDAARIALWINQNEKRGVIVGTWWYWGAVANEVLMPHGVLATPSFNTNQAGLHCYLVTGWVTMNDTVYLEAIPWLGPSVGDNGKVYLAKEIYNALMKQPYTGAFTVTKVKGVGVIPVGYQAVLDHLVYYVRQLFHL